MAGGRWYGARAYGSDRALDLVRKEFENQASKKFGGKGTYSFDMDPNGGISVSGSLPGGQEYESDDPIGYEGGEIDHSTAMRITQRLFDRANYAVVPPHLRGNALVRAHLRRLW